MGVSLRGTRQGGHRASVAGLVLGRVQAAQRREGGAGLLQRPVPLA